MSLSTDMIEMLILEGAVEMAGIDLESGEMLYSFTPKLAEVAPEIYAQVTELFQYEVMNLWEKGFLDIDMLEENPSVYLTDKSFDESELSQLNSMEKRTLDCIIQQFKLEQ